MHRRGMGRCANLWLGWSSPCCSRPCSALVRRAMPRRVPRWRAERQAAFSIKVSCGRSSCGATAKGSPGATAAGQFSTAARAAISECARAVDLAIGVTCAFGVPISPSPRAVYRSTDALLRSMLRLVPAGARDFVADIGLHPAATLRAALALPERRAGLEIIHEKLCGAEGCFAMLRCGQHQHDVVAGLEGAVAMH